MPASNLVIRQATADDAARRDRIHFSSVHRLAPQWYSQEQVAGWSRRKRPDPERLLAQLRKGDAIFIAVLGSRRVGFSELSGDYVRAVYVRANYTGRGFGSALLKAVERAAWRRGIHDVHLDSSINAIPFYESRGYVCMKQSIHRFSNGTEIACGFMQKRLTGS